jgi:hypothetical protein
LAASLFTIHCRLSAASSGAACARRDFAHRPVDCEFAVRPRWTWRRQGPIIPAMSGSSEQRSLLASLEIARPPCGVWLAALAVWHRDHVLEHRTALLHLPAMRPHGAANCSAMARAGVASTRVRSTGHDPAVGPLALPPARSHATGWLFRHRVRRGRSTAC